MSIRYSYRTKGHLSLKELEGLSKLCREEEDVRWAILNANSDLSPYYRRLLAYSKKNKFKFGDFSEAPSDRYKEYKNKYHFIFNYFHTSPPCYRKNVFLKSISYL